MSRKKSRHTGAKGKQGQSGRTGSMRERLHAARVYFQKHDYQRAAQFYESILMQNPGCYEALNNLGLITQSAGQLGKAEVLYRRAIKSEPDLAEAYNNLGNVANSCGRMDKALELFRKAVSIKPDFPEALFNVGTVLHQMNQVNEAVVYYRGALKCKSDYLDAWCNLGVALKQQGSRDEALECFQRALSLNPDHPLARHLSASLRGEDVETAPQDYVRGLFDGMATEFESTLVERLEYTVPTQLKRLIIPYVRQRTGTLNVLDLGCGTGLIGAHFSDLPLRLIGVDLSEKMIREASKKNVYESLYAENITDFLEERAENYDIVIAADVFVYLGDLVYVFGQVRRVLGNEGLFAFSIEACPDAGRDYVLQDTGRYAQSVSYIESLARQFAFSQAQFTSVKIRKEEGQWIEGYCVVLQLIPPAGDQ